MNSKKIFRQTKFILIFLLVMILTSSVSLAAGSAETPDFSDFAGKKIGVATGSVQEKYVLTLMPDAVPVYFASTPELAIALSQNKIDAFIVGELVTESLFLSIPGMTLDERVVSSDEIAFAFAKTPEGETLCNQMNEYIKAHPPEENYELASLYSRTGEYEYYDFEDLPAVNGVVRLGMNAEFPPMCIQTAEGFAGVDCHILYNFFKEYGYGVSLDMTELPSVLMGLSTGVYDMGSATMVTTEERKRSANFSDTYFVSDQRIVIRETDYAGNGTFANRLKTGLYRTFIEEDNYKLLINGLLNTVLITAGSFLLGSALALLITFMMFRKHALPRAIASGYHYLFQGLPTVLVLMITYYVVFAKASVSPLIAAIIGFGLNTASGLAESLYGGITAVSNGQREAAIALGLTPKQTFTGIVFPQAFFNMLPGYRGETIALLKATAIVGYISVQDFTKMGDIIRSRTYDAFFPLITTAIGYFIIVYLLRLLFGQLIKYLGSDDRKRKIKGVTDEK